MSEKSFTTQEIVEKIQAYVENYIDEWGRSDDDDGPEFSPRDAGLVYDIAKLLGATKEQASYAICETPEGAQIGCEGRDDEPENTLVPSEYEITDGHVGRFGATYKTADDGALSAAIAQASEFNNKSVSEIEDMLQSGQPIEWCKSPNYHYDHGKGIIRKKKSPKAPQLVDCDCGHSVAPALRMSASNGTCCPDCYDEMSD